MAKTDTPKNRRKLRKKTDELSAVEPITATEVRTDFMPELVESLKSQKPVLTKRKKANGKEVTPVKKSKKQEKLAEEDEDDNDEDADSGKGEVTKLEKKSKLIKTDSSSATANFYVGNLPYTFNEGKSALEKFFKRKNIKVIEMRGKDKSFCFMTIDGSQVDTMKDLNGVNFRGKPLCISFGAPEINICPTEPLSRAVFFNVDSDQITAHDLESATGGKDGVVISSKRMGYVSLESEKALQDLLKNQTININGRKIRVDAAQSRTATGGSGCVCFKCGEDGHKSYECSSGGAGSGQGGRGRRGGRGVRGGRGGSSGASGCYSCGEEGHFSRECPSVSGCYTCGEEGHISRECPKSGLNRVSKK